LDHDGSEHLAGCALGGRGVGNAPQAATARRSTGLRRTKAAASERGTSCLSVLKAPLGLVLCVEQLHAANPAGHPARVELGMCHHNASSHVPWQL